MATLSLYGAIFEQHPEWPREERLWLEEQLKSLGITSKQYQKDPWKMDNKVWDAVGTWEDYLARTQVEVADPSTPTAPTAPTAPTIVTDSQGNQFWAYSDGEGGWTYELIPKDTAPQYRDTKTECKNGICVVTDAATGDYVSSYSDPQVSQGTWSVVTDATGVYQVNSVTGQRVRISDVPQGTVQGTPTGWAGWGQDWEQYTEFDPTTKTMVTKWRRKPMGYEAALAQGQWANLPENWYNVALMERQLSPEEVKYNWSVPAVVGRMVGGQGAYDLQAWQSAMGITPTGWNANWQAGYGTSTPSGSRIPGTTVGGLPTDPNGPLPTNPTNPTSGGLPTDPNGPLPTNPTNPTSGGYVTYVPSMQDFGSWAPSERQQMYGWLGSGLSGWRTADDYWNEMQKLSAPSGSGRSLYYR